MSLHAQARYEVSEEAVRIARAVFLKGNAYIQLHDTFGALFEDEEFATLSPNNGQPALSPMRLSLC